MGGSSHFGSSQNASLVDSSISSVLMIFAGEKNKIHEGLAQLEDKLKDQAATLQEVQNSLREKGNGSALEARIAKLDDVLTKKVDANLADCEIRFHESEEANKALLDRLEGTTTQLVAAMQEIKTLHHENAELASRELELEHVVQELTAVVETKAAGSRLDEDERMLASAHEKLATVDPTLHDIFATLAEKATSAQLDMERDRITLEEEARVDLEKRTAVALASKTELEQFATELQALSNNLWSQTTALVDRMHLDVTSTLARKVEIQDFDQHVLISRETLERLIVEEQQNVQRHTYTLETLSLKAEKVEMSQLHVEHSEMLALCAREDNVSWRLKQHEEQFDAQNAVAKNHYDQHVASLALHLERDAFDRQWDVFTSKVKTDISDQRDQLNVALEKNDELIRLAEGMQADLTCALALRGRGGICEHKVRTHSCAKCKFTGPSRCDGRPPSPNSARARTPGRA